ncbi:MAG: SH3 domain-containing protein [Pseudomonadota bacterium]
MLKPLLAALLLCVPSLGVAEDVRLGPVTNFPIPRFVSMKAVEANVRRGPSLSHRVDWVFKRRDMPLQITAEHGHWRRVEDRDGQGGWIHYSLLSGTRTVIVEDDLLAIYPRPEGQGQVVAQLQRGVVARLGACEVSHCRISAGGYRGWAPKTALWGVAPDEVR